MTKAANRPPSVYIAQDPAITISFVLALRAELFLKKDTMNSTIDNPLLVVSYNADVRKALVENLARCNASGIPCESFLQAEDVAREIICKGILVDLQSTIKAKGDEKLIACSLTGFYPTFRVRAFGSMVVPMAMPGDAKQDNSLCDFLRMSCAAFIPRRLRMSRRRDAILAVLLGDRDGERAFTLNLSWGGAFIVDTHPERFAVNSELEIVLPDFGLKTTVTVRHIKMWGECHVPGIGVSFNYPDDDLEAVLASIVRHDKDSDRDRMIAR